jgi:hypothetical protein
MDDVTATFLTLITAMILVASLIFTWIRTRAHSNTAAVGLESSRQVELLSHENAGLKGQVTRLEDRISVLERIATDPATRTAHAIDQLRDQH